MTVTVHEPPAGIVPPVSVTPRLTPLTCTALLVVPPLQVVLAPVTTKPVELVASLMPSIGESVKEVTADRRCWNCSEQWSANRVAHPPRTTGKRFTHAQRRHYRNTSRGIAERWNANIVTEVAASVDGVGAAHAVTAVGLPARHLYADGNNCRWRNGGPGETESDVATARREGSAACIAG